MLCDEYYGPPYTEGAITQHLAKLRLRRVEAGLRVPPPLRRSPKEAEKQATALKRKAAIPNDDESELEGNSGSDDGDVGGLFVGEADEEYQPPTTRTKKSRKAKKRTTQETTRPTRTTRNPSLGICRDPIMDVPNENEPGFYPVHPSSAPSPFDVRYRDSLTQPTGGPEAHGTLTDERPTSTAQSHLAPHFVPWTSSMPTYPPVPGDQNIAMYPPYNFSGPYMPNPLVTPTTFTSAGHPTTGSASDMTTGPTFGPGYGSQQPYWYAPHTHSWMQSPVQPARGQGSEAIDPQHLQSGHQAEFSEEGEAANPADDQGLDFKEYVADE